VEQKKLRGKQQQWGTIGEAGVKVIPNSRIEQVVGQGRAEVEMLFGVGHQKEGEDGRERSRVIE
jgi:hypothetical protein